MARSQDGDTAAYLQLLREIGPYLRARIARFHRDPRDIEDTVQDILMTVHAVRRTYDRSRPFAPWLLGIASRRVFDRLRYQSRLQAQETPWSGDCETIGFQPEAVYAAVERRTLEAAIDRLPPGQQQAIRLLKLKELSLKEAAALTGLSIASLKVAVHRAVKNLRIILTDQREAG